MSNEHPLNVKMHKLDNIVDTISEVILCVTHLNQYSASVSEMDIGNIEWVKQIRQSQINPFHKMYIFFQIN